MAPPRANVTGFDVRKFVASSGTQQGVPKDPWGRMEQWRYTGPFSRFNRFKGALPGFGIATVAFAAYCGYEYLFMNDDHHGHAEHKDSERHR